ncbi:MAG: cytochrome c family protein [Pyrinomonadaceae bacterium]|nr:cytochrome c family protein [Pyrinomonadaceae bacterium]
MNKTLLKMVTLVFILTMCLLVLVFGSPATETTLARNVAVAHRFLDSKDLPTGEKAKMTLGKDSTSEHGEVAFNHDTHSFKKYSPDGKTDIGCAECHHTDQPKSALTPPLVTSERAVVLTVEALKKSDAAVVKGCRTCHFQEGNIPDGKEMPVTVFKNAKGKEETKESSNEVAYHNNCNSCHDAAAKLRPELKKKAGFATTNDCLICHKKN